MRDELARPAEISEMFLKDWETREKDDRARMLKVRHRAPTNRSAQRRLAKYFLTELHLGNV